MSHPSLPSVPAATAQLDLLVRQTRVHHVQLSMMADSKASMLLTVASICVTLAAPRITDAAFRYPALVLMLCSLATVIMATLAVMPKLRSGPASAQPQQRKGFNILFFADFTQLSYSDYLAEMDKVMANPGAAYEVQLAEIYGLGQYLIQQKYRWLRRGYIAFIGGLLLSSLAWGAQALIY